MRRFEFAGEEIFEICADLVEFAGAIGRGKLCCTEVSQ